MIYVSQEELNEACKAWQKRLRLQDWEVEISIQRRNNFKVEGRQAEVIWHINSKQAKIAILDPQDYSGMYPQDMENSLVHELLHLQAAPFDETTPGSSEETALEQFIELTTAALVNLRRTNNVTTNR